MSSDDSNTPSDFAARHLARRGASAIEKMQLTLDLARTLLSSGAIEPYGEGEDPFVVPPFAWEVSEPRPGAIKRIFLGSVIETATGQGITYIFIAGLARDEDEFRRQLSQHIGRFLANGAKIGRGPGGPRFSPTFVSPRLKEVRRTRPMSMSGLIFRVTRIHPVSGMMFEIVARRRRDEEEGD